MNKIVYILILLITLVSCSAEKAEDDISAKGVQNTESVQLGIKSEGVTNNVPSESISEIDSSIDFNK